MSRWEPNARERLVAAALDLFGEQGYEATTTAEIAVRAGLTKTTFFRHFPDKREVLFAGQDAIGELLADGVIGAPAGSTPLEAVAAGLHAAASTFPPERRGYGPRLRSVIEANDELREREAYKHAHLASSIAEALRDRGVPDPAAGLAAELGVRAFTTGFARWCEPDSTADFAALAQAALWHLQSAAAALR